MHMARPSDRCSAGEALLKRMVSTSHSVMVTMLDGYSNDQNSMKSIGPESHAFPVFSPGASPPGSAGAARARKHHRSSRESLLWE
jgi:hypothetical protein